MNASGNGSLGAELAGLQRSLVGGSLVCCCLMLGLTVAGGVGNAISIFIYFARSNGSISVLLGGLGLFDLTMLVCGSLVFFPAQLAAFASVNGDAALGRRSFYVATLSVRYVYPFMMIAQTGAVWCLVLITVERFLAVCYPFTARVVCTWRRTLFGFVLVLLYAVLFNLSRFFEYSIFTTDDGSLRLNDQLRRNTLYHTIYTLWMYFIFMFSLPFIAIIGLTSNIVLTIRKANKVRRHMTTQQAKESRTTTMMIVLVVIFILSNILPFALSIMEFSAANRETDWSYSDQLWLAFWTDVSNLLVMINSSTNFPVYLACSQSFRKQVYALLRTQDTHQTRNEEVSRYSEARPSLTYMAVADVGGRRSHRASDVDARHLSPPDNRRLLQLRHQSVALLL